MQQNLPFQNFFLPKLFIDMLKTPIWKRTFYALEEVEKVFSGTLGEKNLPLKNLSILLNRIETKPIHDSIE